MSTLDRNTYLIREHVGLVKLHEEYDVLDAETGAILARAVEEASTMRRMLKLVVSKRLLPFTVHLSDASGKQLLTIRRGVTFLRSKVSVTGPDGSLLGTFRQRLISLGGRFDIFDANDQKVAEWKGNLVGWNFQFVAVDGKELGVVTRKWGGIGKELFTSADNYVVHLAAGVDPIGMGPLLLAAALCIDMVLKEQQS